MPNENFHRVENPLAFAEQARRWELLSATLDPIGVDYFPGEAEAEYYVRGYNACAELTGAELIAVLRDPDGVYYHTPAMDCVEAKRAVASRVIEPLSRVPHAIHDLASEVAA